MAGKLLKFFQEIYEYIYRFKKLVNSKHGECKEIYTNMYPGYSSEN